MAMALQRHVLVLFLLACLIGSSYSYQFTAGGKDGWIPNPTQSYNQWSQHMRFQIGDTVLFKYKQGSDSVLEVNKDDYDKCNTQSPIKKMEDGNSIFALDRAGPFYFISGNKDNCEKGQKVQIVVISPRGKTPTTPPAPQTPAPSATTPAASPPKGSSTPTTPSPNGAPISPPAGTTPTSSPPSPGGNTPTSSPPSPGGNTPTSSPPTPGGNTPTSSPPTPGSSTPTSSPTPAGSQLSPPSPSPGGTLTPAISPAANAPPTNTPISSPSPGASITPSGSLAPAAGGPSGGPSLSPSGSVAPAAGGPSLSPSGPLAPGSSAPGSRAPGPGGNTPADINSPGGSPGGAPANPNSFAVKAFTPPTVLVSAVSAVLVLTMAFGEFITFTLRKVC